MIRRTRKSLAAAALASSLLFAAAPALGDYDPEDSGHPLRIAAYVAYPVGYIIDTLIFRPANWIVQFQPFKALFGNDD